MTEPSASPPLDADARAYAVGVLRDVLTWRQTRAGWLQVPAMLDAVEAAAASGDADAFRAAVDELELASPSRASTRFPDEPDVTPPAPVAESVERLVYSLDDRPPAPPTDD